jgi:hypothetical protein
MQKNTRMQGMMKLKLRSIDVPNGQSGQGDDAVLEAERAVRRNNMSVASEPALFRLGGRT